MDIANAKQVVGLVVVFVIKTMNPVMTNVDAKVAIIL
jgi:hypothetical protein